MKKILLIALSLVAVIGLAQTKGVHSQKNHSQKKNVHAQKKSANVQKKVARNEESPLSIWAMHSVWNAHNDLRRQMMDAIRRGDIKTMEKVCTQGTRLIPCDPIWHYNLACALAYRGEPGLAFTELDKAINFGFRDAAMMAQDSDLKRVQKYPRFKELVKKAESLKGKPVAWRPNVLPKKVASGGVAVLNVTNVVWDFETGLYEGFLDIEKTDKPLSVFANQYALSRGGKALERPYVAAWLSEGSAAGNEGDIYLNRDLNHSRIKVKDFPLLTEVKYEKEAEKFAAATDIPNMVFKDRAVFGNVSRAKMGVFWRSLMRGTYTEPGLAARMNMLYLSNQFWVFPAHKDYGYPEIGDTYPGLAPYAVTTKGSSWTDIPFMNAALAVSASLRPAVKKYIISQRLMGPTMQWIFRRNFKGVKTQEDYLSSKAHPVVFTTNILDVVSMVKHAHSLKIEDIPPAAAVNVVNSRLFPIKFPQPVVDYPDICGEIIYATPTATAFALRSKEAKRTFLFQAKTYPEHNPLATFEWKVVGGDPSFVKIETPLGERTGPESGIAQITIDRTKLTNRIDIAVFAKNLNSEYGAPSFISFTPIALEKREYAKDGKLISIDYRNEEQVYCDPLLALPRNWKDIYRYTKSGEYAGYDREINGKIAASFAPNGERVISRKADGMPLKTIPVRYLPRNTGVPNEPPELIYMDEK
jgi:hypothetical protein